MQSELKQNFIIALVMSILFGLGWGMGLAATSSIRIVAISTTLQAIFIFLTGFQGLWIFLMHCVRSEEARKEWKTWIYVITCCHKDSLIQAKKTKHVSCSGTMGAPSNQNTTKKGKVDLLLHPEESFFPPDTSTSQSSKDPHQQSSNGDKMEQIGLILLNPSTVTEGLTTMDSNEVIENTDAVLGANEVGTESALFDMQHDKDSIDVHVNTIAL